MAGGKQGLNSLNPHAATQPSTAGSPQLTTTVSIATAERASALTPHLANTQRHNADDIERLLSGTFNSPENSSTDLSFTFTYPRYVLNPSRTTVWTHGTEGSWELVADHPSLTASEKADDWYVLTMTLPNDPTDFRPSKVKFDFDEDGSISLITLASFMGRTFQNGTRPILHKAVPHPRQEAERPVSGLARAGYSVDRCLICGGHRSARSHLVASDARGYGLCDDCELQYGAWKRVLANMQSGTPSESTDQELATQFKSTY